MKRIAVLGSTGSIGKSTLKIAEHLKDSLQVTALAAHSNAVLLAEQIAYFNPQIACIYDSEHVKSLQARFPHVKIVYGDEGLAEIVSEPQVDYVVMAIVGMRALKPTVQAIEAGKTVGLASKEVLVSAGEYITTLAKQKGVDLLPIDSEHSAIFQCLEGKKIEEIKRVILTASGGPFRGFSQDQLAHVTVEDALAHPTWNMGPKVTIDCSTLINKGLEMIEARWFFNLPPEKIEVIIHPQSLIHSFVEFIDGTLLAQIHVPNMIYPIQYALTYPNREPGMFPPFDFVKNHQMTFLPPDLKLFPALRLAQESMQIGGSAPAFLNAANEELVYRFIKRQIPWSAISSLLEKLLSKHQVIPATTLDSILTVDREAREEAILV
jgi:1-deoxy-D-xylulose-5-phosphate reductoisomerase